MGKSKNNNRSELEFLRGEIRRLQKLVRQAEKHHRNLEDIILAEEPEIIKTKASCPECREGEIKLILSLDIKDIYCCSSCNFRKVIKK